MTDFPRLYAETLRHEHPESVAIIEAEARDRVIAEIRDRLVEIYPPLNGPKLFMHAEAGSCMARCHQRDAATMSAILDALSAAHDKEGRNG